MSGCCEKCGETICVCGGTIKQKLSPWFDVKEDGLPTRTGIYQWEIWIADRRIETKAMFYPNLLGYIVIDGRTMEITDDDCWRGIVT